MLRSMTGYGRAEQAINDKIFLIEIRSLNGKQFDLQLKLPQLLKPFEFEIRNILSASLIRGSVECMITLKQNGAARPVTINTELAKSFYRPLAELSEELQLDKSHILSNLLKLPEVIVPSTDVLTENEFNSFKSVLSTALAGINHHRNDEGRALENDLIQRIDQIMTLQEQIGKYEPQRKVRLKENLTRLLAEEVGRENYDTNRLEQELIYYIEKLDISEEKVRLQNHCHYFKEILNEEEPAKGKKLSFVLQEIGREINTTGSKANDSTVQKLVVLMKDELEKAKEQVLNVL